MQHLNGYLSVLLSLIVLHLFKRNMTCERLSLHIYRLRRLHVIFRLKRCSKITSFRKLFCLCEKFYVIILLSGYMGRTTLLSSGMSSPSGTASTSATSCFRVPASRSLLPGSSSQGSVYLSSSFFLLHSYHPIALSSRSFLPSSNFPRVETQRLIWKETGLDATQSTQLRRWRTWGSIFFLNAGYPSMTSQWPSPNLTCAGESLK